MTYFRPSVLQYKNATMLLPSWLHFTIDWSFKMMYSMNFYLNWYQACKLTIVIDCHFCLGICQNEVHNCKIDLNSYIIQLFLLISFWVEHHKTFSSYFAEFYGNIAKNKRFVVIICIIDNLAAYLLQICPVLCYKNKDLTALRVRQIFRVFYRVHSFYLNFMVHFPDQN